VRQHPSPLNLYSRFSLCHLTLKSVVVAAVILLEQNKIYAKFAVRSVLAAETKRQVIAKHVKNAMLSHSLKIQVFIAKFILHLVGKRLYKASIAILKKIAKQTPKTVLLATSCLRDSKDLFIAPENALVPSMAKRKVLRKMPFAKFVI
jgi:hypothetical protein